jgi:hypothetical protein
MRIVHVANIDVADAKKKSSSEQKMERCILMLKNQKFEDQKKAEKLFGDRIAVAKKILKL